MSQPLIGSILSGNRLGQIVLKLEIEVAKERGTV